VIYFLEEMEKIPQWPGQLMPIYYEDSEEIIEKKIECILKV
jgi:hypothetical protein